MYLYKKGNEMSQSQYAALGVDAGKEGVREEFSGIPNDFPGSFVTIRRSKLFPGFVRTQHGDGDGSKSIARVLMYHLTGNDSWFRGMVDDALSMNFGDIAAGGFVDGEFNVTDIINLNGFHVPKQKMLHAINVRMQELLALYAKHGFRDVTTVDFFGGETADLPRQVQTSVFDITVSAYMPEAGVIRGNVQPGDRIWGLASDGQAVWEKVWNSGLMSNGVTLAMNVLLCPSTRAVPTLLPTGVDFQGRYTANSWSGVAGMTIAEALLSPTRQWAIFIKMLVDELKSRGLFHLLHGITMNTGGGATKVLHLGMGILYRKNMPSPSDMFQLIQKESGENWRNMLQTFNCGIGIDVIGHENLDPVLNLVAEQAGIQLHDLGTCERWGGDGNHVVLQTPYGTFDDY